MRSLMELHMSNIATVATHYNRLSRPSRRDYHAIVRRLPPADAWLCDVEASFLDDVVTLADLAASIDAQFGGPQLLLVE